MELNDSSFQRTKIWLWIDRFVKQVKLSLEINSKIITVKPFVQSLINDRDPSNFDRGLDNGYIRFKYLIYLLILIFKLDKNLVKRCFSIENIFSIMNFKI